MISVIVDTNYGGDVWLSLLNRRAFQSLCKKLYASSQFWDLLEGNPSLHLLVSETHAWKP